MWLHFRVSRDFQRHLLRLQDKMESTGRNSFKKLWLILKTPYKPHAIWSRKSIPHHHPLLPQWWSVQYLCHTLAKSGYDNEHGLSFWNLRSKSRCPLCVILRPPFSSSCSRTPIFSNACITLRSTLPEASTWWDGREPRLRVEPWTFRSRPTPTVLRR